MAKLKITTTTGETVEVEGRRFSHYVANCRFWFFLHKEVGGNMLTVTHCDSGKRVCGVPHFSVAACLNDSKAAAKMELDKLIARVGEARVRSVLAASEKGNAK